MKLLPNEENVLTSNEDKIILTNYRVQMTDSLWGQSFNISIFLEDISSIEVKYRSYPFLILLGVLFVLSGSYLGGQHGGSGAMTGGIVLGLLFFAAWWFTRKRVISISSDGGSSLNFIVTEMSDDTVADFIYKLSLAKNNRVNQLQRTS
ncbi:MAG: hypothetical protein NT040_16120 [Bacteroidetes bacterium]|nr:hypothetical protein [Bacteroidota bacterium]